MAKRKHACTEDKHQPKRSACKQAKRQKATEKQESSELNSDESHRTEQLLHRGSVTPPRRQPLRGLKTNQVRVSRNVIRKALPSPTVRRPAYSTSEEEADILHYSPDTALYYPGTDLVIDGWFQPCR